MRLPWARYASAMAGAYRMTAAGFEAAVERRTALVPPLFTVRPRSSRRPSARRHAGAGLPNVRGER